MDFSFGPLTFSLYGFIMGAGALVTWFLFEHVLKRLPQTKDLREADWTWGVACLGLSALIGARLYHVITDWTIYAARPWPAVLEVWNGGLGWYGGVIGLLIGLWVWKKLRDLPFTWGQVLDALAISVPFGQAVGRWGNFVNQEVFGPPSNLPWAIFIAPENRPEVWQEFSTFHPLFLYESLGTLAIGIGLWLLSQRGGTKKSSPTWPNLGSGGLLALYLIVFSILRFVLDFLRSDLLVVTGLSVSQWISLVGVLVGVIILRMSFQRWIGTLGLALLVSLGLTVGVTHFTPRAQAQNSGAAIDLSVVPAVVEITVQPGKSLTRAFTVRNSGRVNLQAVTTLQDFISDHRTGAPVLTSSSQFPYASLVNADRRLNETYPLPAGGEQQLVLSLNIPEDAQERDWYVVLLTKTVPQEPIKAETSQASSNGSIGATLLIRIARNEETPLQWALSFQKLPQWFDSLRPLTIEPVVENLNPSLAVPELTITLRDWRGRLVYSQEALPERVLAHSSRAIRAAKKSTQTNVELEPTNFIFDPPFAIGRYTLEGQIANQAGTPLVVEKTIWAIPASLIFGFIGVILALGIWRWLVRRTHVRSQED